MEQSATKLSVNLNKFALLRNARGTDFPNLLQMARRCIAAGVHGITVHPRPDERHTKRTDVFDLAELVANHSGVEFNVEGNPTSDFLDLVRETRPDQCTLVPDDPYQLTSDHGWNVTQHGERLRDILRQLHASRIRVSLFMETDEVQIEAAKQIGADRIELYTGPYAHAFIKGRQEALLEEYHTAATKAQELGLGVNAGHDLNLSNLGLFLQRVPGILEVSIGHAIAVESFDFGLESTLAKYLEIVSSSGE